MMFSSLKLLLLVLCVWSAICSAQDVIDICECDPVGSLSADCGDDRQCDCKPGVGGLRCQECLPGYGGFGIEGCSPLDECQCHPRGSLSAECDSNGVCVCRLGIQGDKCDTCQDGFRRIDLGCIPCPTCFDQVAAQFNQTLELYQDLLQRLNETLFSNTTGGSELTPDDIAMYGTLLNDLLQRSLNATERQDDLAMDLIDFQSDLSILLGSVTSLDLDVTVAEASIVDLTAQANRTQALTEQLQVIVSSLNTRVNLELSVQLEDLLAVNQQLRRQFQALRRLAQEANTFSLDQESEAARLLSSAVDMLNNATRALQQLQEAIRIQNQTLQIVSMIRNETLPLLEAIYSEGTIALANVQINVPSALENATQILNIILNITTPEYNLESRQQRLAKLQMEIITLNMSAIEVSQDLDILAVNFTAYNETATKLIAESEALSNEASNLLAFAEASFSSANDSVTSGDGIIAEAQRLLMELQSRLTEGRDFTAGLEEVIRNIERAEIESLLAENVTMERGRELMDALDAANRAASLLESASDTLMSAFQVATAANTSAHQLLDEALALNSTATEFAGEVNQARDGVDRLEEAVQDDTVAIAMVSDTANETINAAADLAERLRTIRDVLTNLTDQLDAVTLISPERISDITSTLITLEQDSASNQMLVDSLTDQVRQLQDSADELRARYTQVQQHRDLLQDILRNVEDLNCREQFEN